MNFDLADKLKALLFEKQLDQAIQIAEQELRSIPHTDFHAILGKDLLHLTIPLQGYLRHFHEMAKESLNKKRNLLNAVFTLHDKMPGAYYCEMNGFTINWDRWFIDSFAFKEFKDDDWDWLSDFYDTSDVDFTISGFEEFQDIFKDIHENDRFEDQTLMSAYEIAELIIILRLQELFRAAYTDVKGEWSRIPMYVTAHDYGDFIYRPN